MTTPRERREQRLQEIKADMVCADQLGNRPWLDALRREQQYLYQQEQDEAHWEQEIAAIRTRAALAVERDRLAANIMDWMLKCPRQESTIGALLFEYWWLCNEIDARGEVMLAGGKDGQG